MYKFRHPVIPVEVVNKAQPSWALQKLINLCNWMMDRQIKKNFVKNHKLCFLVMFLAAAAHATNYGEGTTVNTDPLTYTAISQSTGACAASGGGATLVVNRSSSTLGTIFCNEGSAAVRIGNSAVTSAIGLYVGATNSSVPGCVVLDFPRFFRGNLYCISTNGSTQNFSTLQASP